MSEENQNENVHSMQSEEDGAIDAKGWDTAERGQLSESASLEKEERQDLKKKAKKAKKGEYVVTRALKCDGKLFKRGDEFEGKVYYNLTEGKSPVLVKKSDWDKR